MHSSALPYAQAPVAVQRSAGRWRHALQALAVDGGSVALEILCMRVGGQDYALPMDQVEGLMHHQEGQVLLAEGAAFGGAPVLVLDLAALLGARTPLQADVARPLRAVVVVARGARRLGLVVDLVQGVLSVDSSQLRPALPAQGADDAHCLATVRAGGRRIRLLSADTWFALADSPYVVQA